MPSDNKPKTGDKIVYVTGSENTNTMRALTMLVVMTTICLSDATTHRNYKINNFERLRQISNMRRSARRYGREAPYPTPFTPSFSSSPSSSPASPLTYSSMSSPASYSLYTNALDVRLPPSIYIDPVAQVIFRQQQQIVLDCASVGAPLPVYEWTKDGVLFYRVPPADPSVTQSSPGRVVFNATLSSAGVYQCKAINDWGISLGSFSRLILAVANAFPSSAIASFSAPVGSALMLPCYAPESVPAAGFSWALATGPNDTAPTTLLTSSRIQINPLTGDLHLANIQATDQLPVDKYYKCNSFNSVLDVTYGGSYATVIAQAVSSPKDFISVAYSVPSSPVTALLGQTITLGCFFNGYPTPLIGAWRRTSGSLPTGRYSYSNFNTLLTINNIQQNDTGTYECLGSNSAGSATVSITLTIESAPWFNSLTTQPRDINATDGDTITFTCSPEGLPPPSGIWYRNSVVLSPTSLPPRFTISPDFTALTVTNVCKTCPDGSSDLAVIECIVTNSHGTTLTGGYLNVILPTVISRGPIEELPSPPGESLVLPCAATSDPSTPVAITWYIEGVQVSNVTGVMYVDDAGSLHVISPVPPSGNYTCLASNGFSSDVSSARIGAAVTKSAALNWWIILLILLALLILLISLIGFLVCYVRSNPGAKYPVDKYEQLTGNDPVEELKQSGFHEHIRPDASYTVAYTSAPPPVYTKSAAGRAPLFEDSRTPSISLSMAMTASMLSSIRKLAGAPGIGASLTSSIVHPASISENDGASLSEIYRVDGAGSKFNDEGSFVSPIGVTEGLDVSLQNGRRQQRQRTYSNLHQDV